MKMLPLLKECTKTEGCFTVKRELRFFFDDEGMTSCAKTLLTDSLNRLEIGQVMDKNADVEFKKIVDARNEYYSIEVTSKKITARYTDKLSARNAAATLIAKLVKTDETYVIECGKAEDYANNKYRGFMLDVARRFIDIDKIKLLIRQLAHAKFNKLHLHLLDTERYAIQSEIEPCLNRKPIFRQYTIGQMKDIVSYAASFGLDVIPDLDLPGHGLFLLETMPKLKCIKGNERIGIWDLCVANELSYELIEKLIKELTEIFPYEYIHMGGDELCFYDMKDSGYWMQWEHCDCCKKLSKENGYIDASDLYCHFVRRVYDIIKANGKKMMIFNDSIDISRTPDLPRDILIHFWRVAVDTRGPNKGCNMQRFLDEGFDVVNSFYEECYIDDYVTIDKLSVWQPTSSPKVVETAGKVIGGEMCAWGIRNHFEYTWPAAILMFGDRLWNEAPLTIDEELTKALTRQIITNKADFADIFGLLGGGLMPLYGADKFYKTEKASHEKITSALEAMTRVMAEGRCETNVLMAYVRCLEDALKAYIPQEKV